MICSDEKLDSHRFKDIIDDAISQGLILFTKYYLGIMGTLKYTPAQYHFTSRHANLKKTIKLKDAKKHPFVVLVFLFFPGAEVGFWCYF